MPLQPTLPTKLEPTAQQLAYVLYTGKRFTLGFEAHTVRQTVCVVNVHMGWVEYDVENEDGTVQRPTRSISNNGFRATILAELTPLTREQIEKRGYS